VICNKQWLSGTKPVGLPGWQAKAVSSEDRIRFVPVSDHLLVNTLNHAELVGFQTLKEKYVQYFGVRTDNTVLLQGVVRDLINESIQRRTLVAWAVKAGYTKRYVSSWLSRLLVSLGLREREPGAGRRPSPWALEPLTHVQRRYGEDFFRHYVPRCARERRNLW
jgi:hypothetical protein